jgi:hypothetical protein
MDDYVQTSLIHMSPLSLSLAIYLDVTFSLVLSLLTLWGNPHLAYGPPFIAQGGYHMGKLVCAPPKLNMWWLAVEVENKQPSFPACVAPGQR